MPAGTLIQMGSWNTYLVGSLYYKAPALQKIIQLVGVPPCKREVTRDTTEIPWSTRKFYKQFYANKLNNLEEMDKFLKIYKFPILNQEETENLNRPITIEIIKSIIKKLPTSLGHGFRSKFYKTFKEKSSNYSKKTEEEGRITSSF